MENFIKLILPMISSAFLNTIGNTLWKMSLNKSPIDYKSIDGILSTLLSLSIISGVLCYFLSMLIFFYLLSHFPLSVVVPITALTYILNFLAAMIIFDEKISINMILGGLMILIGIFLITQK